MYCNNCITSENSLIANIVDALVILRSESEAIMGIKNMYLSTKHAWVKHCS